MSAFDTQSTTESFVETIVQEKGENWKDPEVLAKGYKSAQDHIKELERVNSELKEDLTKAKTTEELLEQLEARQKGSPPAGNVEPTASGANETRTEVGLDEVKNLVAEAITEREAASTSTQNVLETDRLLSEKFGTEAGNTVSAKAKELGLTLDRMKSIASESPTAFMRLVGEPVKEANPSVSSATSTSFDRVANPSGEKDWSYYQNLRRTNPSEYYTPRVQNAMLADKDRLGDRFGNT